VDYLKTCQLKPFSLACTSALFDKIYYSGEYNSKVALALGGTASLRTTTKSRKESVDLLIVRADELLTLKDGGSKPRTGKQMRDLGIIRDGALAVREGRIIATGKTLDLTKTFKSENVINARGKTVLPGFIDPHTHLIFAGSGEEEFQMRVEGKSCAEVKNYGSVLNSVKETRKARFEKLVDLGLERLDAMLLHGTTTVEAKSGYGLTSEDELKILEVIRRLNQLHSINVVSTFMGAHAIPPEYRGN
jgi:imidazolonepropionase